MSTRIARLWQPGNPQTRVFFPDFWLRLVETPEYGYKRLPKNAAKFEVDTRMSRMDVREYLEKIYNLPVRDVRTEMKMGEITWDAKLDQEKRKALWKEEDRKYAYVFFPKDVVFEFPKVCDAEVFEEEIQKMQKFSSDESTNEKYVNRNRAGIGGWYGV